MSQRLISTVIRNKDFVSAATSTTVAEAARLMKKHNIGALPVCEDRRLVGIFTERDAVFRVTAEGRDPDRVLLANVMTPDPQTTRPDRPLGHALYLMYRGGFRHVPVVANGQPVGMISSRDVLGPDLQEFASEMDEREHLAEILG